MSTPENSTKGLQHPLVGIHLFYNQPAPDEQPPTIRIIDNQTLAVHDQQIPLTIKQRIMFNALASNRDRGLGRRDFVQEGFMPTASPDTLKQAFTEQHTKLLGKLTVDGFKMIETRGRSRGRVSQLNKNVLILDDRPESSRPTAKHRTKDMASKQKNGFIPYVIGEHQRTFLQPAGKPNIDLAWARESTPHVFSKLYSEEVYRPYIIKMATFFQDRDAEDIENRVQLNYTNRKLRKATETILSDDVLKDLASKAATYRRLSAAEEIGLAQTIKIGTIAFREMTVRNNFEDATLYALAREGATAYKVLFNCNLRLPMKLVRKVAPSYPHTQVHDILQLSYYGLQTAIEKFDERKDKKFSTYAMVWIRQAVSRNAGNEGRIISIPDNKASVWRSINILASTLTANNRRPPTHAELAAQSKYTAEEISEILRMGETHMRSTNEKISKDSEVEVGEVITDESAQLPIEAIITHEQAMNLIETPGLTAQERFVLSLHYGIKSKHLKGTQFNGRSSISYDAAFAAISEHTSDITMVQLSDMLKIDPETVGRIEKRAIQKIRLIHGQR